MSEPTLFSDKDVRESAESNSADRLLDAHVVILNNYLHVHHTVSYVELAKRVRKLTVLLSVPMEPNRVWEADWRGLDVRVQKNWMFTKRWKHSRGFSEKNFIHVPVDTVKQLKQLQPDIVFSYEMGFRTLLAGRYRRRNRKVPLVMVGNMSDAIERERGLARRMLRRVICRNVDLFSYNGASCKRYLKHLGVGDSQLFPIPYCVDTAVVYGGPRESRIGVETRTLLYCGAVSERKGILEFATVLARWCDANPGQQVVLKIAGSGDLVEQVTKSESSNLAIKLLGNLDADGLREAYRDADIYVNPSFADEWGLTTVEALASGIPVMGCLYTQSVETLVREGTNGWGFKTEDENSVMRAVEAAMGTSGQQLDEYVLKCRQSVAHISAEATAERFCDVIRHALPTIQ